MTKPATSNPLDDIRMTADFLESFASTLRKAEILVKQGQYQAANDCVSIVKHQIGMVPTYLEGVHEDLVWRV